MNVLNLNATPDPVRVLRRSLRCFLCGLLGAVPLVGLGLADEAVRLHGQVVRETREPWQGIRFTVYGGIGIFWVLIYQFLFGVAMVGLPLALFLGFGAYLLQRQYATGAGNCWNAARAYLYWGLGFAYAAYFLSAAVLSMGLVWVSALLAGRK